MKQTSNSSAHYCLKYDRDDEFEVAAVLLELPALIIESDSALRLPLSWGSKKRRSANDTSFVRRVPLPLPPVPSVMVSAFKPEMPTVKVEASSPATPLSFSPSESDEKAKRSKRKLSVKKTKEEWLEIIDKYTQSNESLTKEIENMRRNHDKLKANNLWLQARKQELRLGFSREKPNLEAKSRSSSLNLEVKLGQAVVKASTSSVVGFEGHHHHQHNHNLRLMVDQRSLIMDRTDNKDQSYPYQTLSSFPSRSHGLGMNMNMNMIINDNYVGPTGIPDLNVSPGESSLWMDFAYSVDDNNKSLNKAIAAQARQRRMQICRDKNSNATTKLRFSHR